MATNYVFSGDVLTITAGADLSSGDVVVVGEQIGVCFGDIANGATGTVAMSGVWDLPKVSDAVIAQGEEVIWDASAEAFDDNAASAETGDVTGCCVAAEAAGDGVTTIRVKLNVGIGTVN